MPQVLPGSAGDVFDFTAAQENTFMLEGCEIQVFVRDDQTNPENTATMARELIDVEDVDILVGTVSSGATATLQGIAFESKVPLIVAPAAANDITGERLQRIYFPHQPQQLPGCDQRMSVPGEAVRQLCPDRP